MPDTGQMPAGAVHAPAVRPGHGEDVAEMARLHLDAFGADKAWDAPALLRLVETPGVFALVAEDEDALTGFVLMQVAADEAEVLTICTSRAHRRRGLGRALVMAGLTTALAVECRSVFLEVAADNPAAKALYASVGFQVAGRRENYYLRKDGPSVDAEILRWTAADPSKG